MNLDLSRPMGPSTGNRMTQNQTETNTKTISTEMKETSSLEEPHTLKDIAGESVDCEEKMKEINSLEEPSNSVKDVAGESADCEEQEMKEIPSLEESSNSNIDIAAESADQEEEMKETTSLEPFNSMNETPSLDKLSNSIKDVAGESVDHEEEIPADVTKKKVEKQTKETPLLSCSECSFITKYRGSMRRHKNTHRAPQFVCECGKKFCDNWEFEYHIVYCKTSIICDQCGKSYQTRQSFRDHRRAHDDLYRYKCTTCDFKSNSKNHFTGHMNMHTKTKFKCKCGSEFTFPSDFKSHQVDCLNKGAEFSCGVCNTKFSNTRLLKAHVVGMHSEEKRFRCKRCNKSFRWSSSLSYHSRSGKCF